MTFFGLFGVVYSTSAQISITSDDFPTSLGTVTVSYSDTTDSIPVNVGSAGGPQVWDFTQIPPTCIEITQRVVSPEEATPYSDQFPEANYIVRGNIPISMMAMEGFKFQKISQDSLLWLGMAGDLIQPIPASGISIVWTPPMIVAPLPLEYNDSWSTSSTTSLSIFGFSINVSVTEQISVDAWGKIKLPLGDFDCLRLRINSVSIVSSAFYSDTITTISYTWAVKDKGFVVTIDSRDGETDPEFTVAGSYTVLKEIITGVETPLSSTPVRDFSLFQNYPNPFNPGTTIQYQLPSTTHATLKIYNLLGQEIRTLVNARQSHGLYKLHWDGRDDLGRDVPSGVYIYKLQAGDYTRSRKMELIR